jgi:hypothetical protein
VGITDDNPVRIRNFFVPMDFMVVEMDVYRQIPLILERSFLSTTGAMIDVAGKRRHPHSKPRVSKSATKS